jgi:proline iminopeptidase
MLAQPAIRAYVRLLVASSLSGCRIAHQQGSVAQPAAEEWDYVADDGVRHYVTEFGRGDTVVVLHGGWGGDISGLLDAVRPLADRFHFVLYDQRGSLRSPAPESTLTVTRLVRDLDGLRRQLGQERLTIFAHSMGAVLSYAYLAAHPENVERLVLAAAVLPMNDFRILRIPPSDTARLGRLRRELNEAQGVRRAATLAAAGLARADSTSFTDRERAARWRIGLASRMVARPERWRDLRGGPSFYNPRVGEAIDRNMTPAARDSLWSSFLPALLKFRGPVTVMIGDADFIDPQGALWRYAATQLPNTALMVISGAGHSAWIDEPERFAATAADGLSRAARRP